MQNSDGLPVIPDEIKFVFGDKVNHVPTPFTLEIVKDWLTRVDTQPTDQRDDLTVLLMETIWQTVDAWVRVGAPSDLRGTQLDLLTHELAEKFSGSHPRLSDRLIQAREPKHLDN